MRAKSVNEKLSRGGDPFSTMGVGVESASKALEVISANLKKMGIESEISRYEDVMASDWSGWMLRIKKRSGYRIEPVIFTVDGHDEYMICVRTRNYEGTPTKNRTHTYQWDNYYSSPWSFSFYNIKSNIVEILTEYLAKFKRSTQINQSYRDNNGRFERDGNYELK